MKQKDECNRELTDLYPERFFSSIANVVRTSAAEIRPFLFAHTKRFSHSPFVNIVHPKRFGNGVYVR